MRFTTVFAALVMMAATVAADAQKWDMPTPYSDNEFHTLRRERVESRALRM